MLTIHSKKAEYKPRHTLKIQLMQCIQPFLGVNTLYNSITSNTGEPNHIKNITGIC